MTLPVTLVQGAYIVAGRPDQKLTPFSLAALGPEVS